MPVSLEESWKLLGFSCTNGEPTQGKPVIVPEDYPDDNDTNAVAFSILKAVDSRAQDIMNEMLQCRNKEGIIQVSIHANSQVICSLRKAIHRR